MTIDSTENLKQSRTHLTSRSKRRNFRDTVAERRASAKHAAVQEQHEQQQEREEERQAPARRSPSRKPEPANRKARRTVRQAVDDFLLDQESSNHITKTLQWHRGAYSYW